MKESTATTNANRMFAQWLHDRMAGQSEPPMTPKEQALQQENAMLRDTLRHVFATKRLLDWSQQAKALARTYPDFDLMHELGNPAFVKLLCKEEVSLQHAYETMHLDEIKRKLAEQAQNTAQMSLRANRPTEGGVLSRSLPPDPKNMTAADRAKLALRVSKGEKITL